MAGGQLTCRSVALAVIDTFLVLFVFFPLAILHWRGTWDLQDVYFVPSDIFVSSWLSLLVGTVGSLLILAWQPFMYTSVVPADGNLYLVVSRLHMYVCGWTTMCYWRGVWNLMDLYLTEAWLNSVVILVIAQVFTLATRTSRNNVGLPVSMPMLDTDPELLAPDTVYKAQPGVWWQYAADALFTQLVVVTANIAIWRGIWNVYDDFLFPHRHLLSDLTSIVIGYAVLGLLFLLQYPMSMLSARLSKGPSNLPKVVFEDFVMLVATWGNLLLWRGAWDLCVKYVMPDKVVGGWISHWMGTLGLIGLQVFNNVALNGMEKDGDYPGGEGIFPTDYLRQLLMHPRKKPGGLEVSADSTPLLPLVADLTEEEEMENEDNDSGVSLEQDMVQASRQV